MASFFCPLGDPAAACPDKGLYAPVSQDVSGRCFPRIICAVLWGNKKKTFHVLKSNNIQLKTHHKTPQN